jgi:hypothetical protein
MKSFILSYVGNEVMATRLERQLIEKGFPAPLIIYAPDMASEGYKRNRVVFHTFKKYLLPELVKCEDDTIVFEDDADIYSDYDIYARLASKWNMNRIAWWKMNKVKGIPSFCVGSTIVSYKKEFITRLAEEFKKGREQHIDGFLTKKFKWKEDWDYEPNFGYGGTVSHYSYIMNDEFREGNKGSDAPKDYIVPKVDVGYNRITCEKCDKCVPEKYYNGEGKDEMWVCCLHTGWYCPNHSPTSNCDDEECSCCNA